MLKNKKSIWIFTDEFAPNIIGGMGVHLQILAKNLVKRKNKVNVVKVDFTLTSPKKPFIEETTGATVYEIPWFYNIIDTDSSILMDADGKKDTVMRVIQLLGVSPVTSIQLEMIARHYIFDDYDKGYQVIFHAHDFLGNLIANTVRKCSIFIPMVLTHHIMQHNSLTDKHLSKEIVDSFDKKSVENKYNPESVTEEEKHELVTLTEKFYALKTEKTIFVSNQDGEYFKDCFGDVSSRSTTVYNPINEELHNWIKKTNKKKAREKYAPNNEIILTGVGRIAFQKGFIYLLRSAKLLRDQGYNVKVVIAGGYQRDVEFNKEVKLYSKKEVEVVGKLNKKDLAELLVATDIGVITSIYEPFGMVALDFMLAKKPVVANGVGGLTEIVNNKVTGYLDNYPTISKDKNWCVPDSYMLRNLIRLLLDNPKRAKQFGEAGYRRAIKDFSVKQFIDKTISVYDDVLLNKVKDKRFHKYLQTLPSGLTSHEEKYALYNLGKTHNNIVEVGSFCGGSTCYIAQGHKDGNRKGIITTIDSGQAQLEKSRTQNQILLDNLKNFDYLDRVRVIQGDSLKVVSSIPKDSLDALFLDGNHSFNYLERELKEWLPKVKKGGTIAIHDTGVISEAIFGIVGCQKAIDKFITPFPDKFSKMEYVDTLAIFTKLY